MIKSCKNCRYRGDIYFPSTKDQDKIKPNGCFYFAYLGEASDKPEAMYLDDLDGTCGEYRKAVQNE